MILVACATAVFVLPAWGDPYFRIGTAEEWEMALSDGRVEPLQPMEWDEYMFHWQTGEVEGEPYPETQFWPAQLYVLPEPLLPPYPTEGVLVMAWGEDPAQEMNSSAWKYEYGVDPDLSNAVVTLTAYAPPGITKVSFGVRDMNGLDRSWYWNPGVNPGFPNSVFVTVTVDLSKTGLTATNPPADGYLNTPGFDITQVATFLVDETFHVGSSPVTIPPPGTTVSLWWNAWRDLKVEDGQRFKWSQPPDPAFPADVFYGWNEYSEWWYGPTVADDWVCTTPDPVTDVHWWGSFLGWKYTEPPQLPSHFHIQFWTDWQPGEPGYNDNFSHPLQLVHEVYCYNYRWQFVGWDFDPRTEQYEACFKFEQDLIQEEWFHQDLGENIYWISISACYDGQPPADYPWGWKTRPRDPDSPAPDDAVIIFDPVQPPLGAMYVDGMPIWWPTEEESWDMAFELTSKSYKWEQLPDLSLPGLHCHDWEYPPPDPFYGYIKLADDWECFGGDVTDLHWYGNYEVDPTGQELRGSGIRDFVLGIHTCTPGPQGFCVPMEPPLVTMVVPFASIPEIDTGMVNVEGCTVYLYEYFLDNLFPQEPGMYYWLSITARFNDPINNGVWRWQEANRSPMFLGHAPAAEWATAGPWNSIIWTAVDPPRYSDLAFAITSGRDLLKWSQPPMRWIPDDGYNGWDEYSVDCSNQIVADDWLCRTDNPVTDIHWWGSFIGWSEPYLPPQMPSAFQLGIWTDVPAGIDAWFSHPGSVIWVNYCNTYTAEFVGWDWDPRTLSVPEATFKFTQDLPEADWFHQDTGDNIYWLSIAAVYDVLDPQFPFGWKTRPHDPNSPAPDDGVRIFDPTCVAAGGAWGAGEPIYWPTVDDSWDLAFELTTKTPTWCLGDMNCSGGNTEFTDINYFVAAIGCESCWYAYYAATHGGLSPPPGCDWYIGDYPGTPIGVEFQDITPFANSIGTCIPYP